MDKQQAWDKIQKLCPNIEQNNKLAWQLKQNKQWIISNQAVQRIAAYNNIFVTFSEPKEIMGNIYIKATAKNAKTGIQIESFGETSSKNTHNAYPIAMAEKRAHDRAVLKCVDVYSDFYSDVEAEEFIVQDVKEDKDEDEEKQYKGIKEKHKFEGLKVRINNLTKEDFDNQKDEIRNEMKSFSKEQKNQISNQLVLKGFITA